MNEHELLELVNAAKKNFGAKCSKHSGAVTVELIRHALKKHGIETSSRDVYIKGVPIEIDFLVVKLGVVPEHGLIYQPEDVLAAFEIKNSGTFGEKAVGSIKRCFSLIKQSNPKIYCAYVTIAERQSYKWAVREENLGSPAYTLFWHSGSDKKIRHEPTGDWQRLVNDLQKLNLKIDRNPSRC
jgi:hypothetical protein